MTETKRLEKQTNNTHTHTHTHIYIYIYIYIYMYIYIHTHTHTHTPTTNFIRMEENYNYLQPMNFRQHRNIWHEQNINANNNTNNQLDATITAY